MKSKESIWFKGLPITLIHIDSLLFILFRSICMCFCIFYACHPFFLCFYATPFLILFIFLHMVVGKCVFMLVYNSFWLFKAPCIPLSLWQYCNDIDLWSIPPCSMEILLLKWVRSRYKNLQSCKHKFAK